MNENRILQLLVYTLAFVIGVLCVRLEKIRDNRAEYLKQCILASYKTGYLAADLNYLNKVKCDFKKDSAEFVNTIFKND